MIGPGKYDDLCTKLREDADAAGVILIIFDGNLDSGFSVQVPPQILHTLPALLRSLSNQIEDDLKTEAT